MSHRIIIRSNQYISVSGPLGATEVTHSGEPPAEYNFDWSPPHDEPESVTGNKFEKILKHLKKAEAIANGHDHE